MNGKGRRWDRGTCLTSGIRGLLTGLVRTDPQLLPVKPCREVPWTVQTEQRSSAQARERRPGRKRSNLKAALGVGRKC